MTRCAYLISKMEGFGEPSAIPTVQNNPGDLRHGPNANHPKDDPNGIGWYQTAELGWQDLERQLEIYAARGLTLEQAIFKFAPPSENDSFTYLQFVSEGLGLPGDTPMREVLTVEA